jgi:hypothetical protein
MTLPLSTLCDNVASTKENEFRAVMIPTDVPTPGKNVRVRSGDFILNVDEKQVAKGE